MPVLALNALDDPFVDPRSLPLPGPTGDFGSQAPVRLVVHAHGGHCGFVSAEPPAAASPAAPAAAARLQRKDWLPEELGRFVAHCEQSHLCSQAQAAP